MDNLTTSLPPWCFQSHRYLELPAMAPYGTPDRRRLHRGTTNVFGVWHMAEAFEAFEAKGNYLKLFVDVCRYLFDFLFAGLSLSFFCVTTFFQKCLNPKAPRGVERNSRPLRFNLRRPHHPWPAR